MKNGLLILGVLAIGGFLIMSESKAKEEDEITDDIKPSIDYEDEDLINAMDHMGGA